MTFRLAHLSDLHLDYKSSQHTTKQGINVREFDGYIAFQKIVTDVLQSNVDAVLIAGDVFHEPDPSTRAVIFAQNQLRRFAKAKMPVYILAGNHDSSDRETEIASSRILNDPDRKIYSHIEPYVHYEISDGINLHMVSHHMYSEQAKTMKQVKPIKNEINIFSTHGSCIDPIMHMRLHTEQSPREIVIPDELINDNEWDYILLGHIHERMWVGSKDHKTDTLGKKIYYNGSLIRRGFSDAETPLGRGWTLWKIEDNGLFVPEFHNISQRPQVDFPVIDASNKTSNEISEIIIQRLQETQLDGNVFNVSTAPILRQKIKNISVPKYSALDHKNIYENSKHALTWKIKQIAQDEKDTEKESSYIDEKAIIDNGDIMKSYETWLEKSKTYESIDKNIQENVKKQSREFIKLGQEKVLENE